MRQMKNQDARVADLLQVAGRLEGFARHASTHAAGVVISPQPLQEIVPLYKSSKDEITTQYAMDDLEKIGLLKMDFLGLTTLTVLDDCLKLIEQTRGEKLDLEALPRDDNEAYELLSKGLTAGIFQFESRGMTDILRRVKPSRLADLTALNALYRPGPIQGGMIDDFIARKTGRKRVTYDLPVLEADPRRDLRRHRLPGTGDADRRRRRRLQPGRSRRPAPRHGQEETRSHGDHARKVHGRRQKEQGAREEGRKALRPDGAIRRLRIQQIALGRLRPGCLSDRLSENPLPGGIHGGAAHVRNRQSRQADATI